MHIYEIEDVCLHIPSSILEIQEMLSDLIKREEKAYISFINPEIFLKQKDDYSLHNYFVNAKFNFIDGVGLLYAINKYCNKCFDIKSRFPGTDFFTYLEPSRQYRLFLYGGSEVNVKNAKKELECKNKNIKIVGFSDGYSDTNNQDLIERINSLEIDILIVCLGCPLQEKWISQNFNLLNVKLCFGNGGAIDFWSGSIKRASNKMINLGLEWLFRLFQDFSFKRISRQVKLLKFFVGFHLKKYSIREIK